MKLKPCPFCGSFPTLKENHSGSTFVVECVNQLCRIQVKSIIRETEEAVIELWNTRAEEPAERTAHWDIACGTCNCYTPFCSNCGEEPPAYVMTPHCPYCGCKMVTRGHEDT